MSSLKLQEESCSAFGRLVLQYLKDNPQTNMNQLAKQIGVSHAGLGWICLRRHSPSEKTASKIAPILDTDLSKLARLIHENKLESLSEANALTYSVKLDKSWVTRKVPVQDAIAGLNAVFHAFHYVLRSVPEKEKPTDFQVYKQAYEIVRKHLVTSGQLKSKSSG
ncbi:MAG: helix-turn-helix transcriptional regulator [Oscillatoriophycideae cyanobacterium NC_groundwater_1537_Pr4_S-0.65um_50_18]|nr:helix-turn-helix transcriptional regulator [Oscillatoriophycideae cyanobacterium NC_groundwater_1537_Pr4_S-0.65um_50_18]